MGCMNTVQQASERKLGTRLKMHYHWNTAPRGVGLKTKVNVGALEDTKE